MTENEAMRLTTDKKVTEMGMYELAHNCCYIKDGCARYRDFSQDWDARELARSLLKHYAESDDAFTCDDDFDECMIEYLQYGKYDIEGFIALFYRNLWAMADIRELLKEYEAIGTVEDFKELREKSVAKKPIGEYTQCKCSVCGRRVRSGRGSSSFVRDNFCQRCGQKLDWSE